MHGGATTYQVVSLGSQPYAGGPLPIAHEITTLFRKAIADDSLVTFWVITPEDARRIPEQYKFHVRISLADFDRGRYELYDQRHRWFTLDVANPLESPIQFEVITT